VSRLKNGVTVINDATMRIRPAWNAALVALSASLGGGWWCWERMRELGDESRRAHHLVGERAAALVWISCSRRQ